MSGSEGSKHDLTEDDSASDSGQSSNSSASTRLGKVFGSALPSLELYG